MQVCYPLTNVSKFTTDPSLLPLLVRLLALLGFVASILVPLAHGPHDGRGGSSNQTVVASGDSDCGHDHDHDSSTCPVCKALEGSWSYGIVAAPFVAHFGLSDSTCCRAVSVFLLRRIDLSAGTPRAPPVC